MENSSLALYIGAGTLIAIIVISIIVYRWRQIGILESEKDRIVLAKNQSEFNAEFEAYNKSLMYGADVLSCLNKAQNNNQKYVYSNYYGVDGAGKVDREEHFINVQVTLNSRLHDEVKVYYKDNTGKYRRIFNKNVTSPKFNYNIYTSPKLKNIEVYYYYFDSGKLYQDTKSYSSAMGVSGNIATFLKNGGIVETNVYGGTTYNLLKGGEASNKYSSKQGAGNNEAAQLSALISTINLKSQNIDNPEIPTLFDGSDWWYCTWTSAAYDFKSRKFRCTDVQYNEDTGYIERISFVEKE